MQHADPDQLALIALGEPLDDDAAELTAHLQRCELCRQEIDALRQTVTLARETVEYRGELRPPEAVWDRISGDLGLATSSATAPATGAGDFDDRSHLSGPGAPRSPVDGPMMRRAPAAGPDAEGAGGGIVDASAAVGAGASGRGIGAHRAAGRQWGRGVAVVSGVAGTLVAIRPWQDDSPVTVAGSTASLGPVAGGPGKVSGRVVVVQGPDGPELEVTAAGLPLQQGYYEVWVFDGKVNMVAVGVLGADSKATLPLPPTLDLRPNHVVDISLAH